MTRNDAGAADQLLPDTGLLSLALLARFHGQALDIEQLRHELALGHAAISPPELIRAARRSQFKARLIRSSVDRLATTPLPALARYHDGSWVILVKADAERVLIQCPLRTQPELLEREVLESQWTGELLLLTSRALHTGALRQFDLTWFVPAIVKYRRLLGEVFLVSLLLQLLGLVSPLLFQVVMDKVLVHHSYTTLDVILFGLIVVLLFESAFSLLRTYVFSHTTSRMDVELGAGLFQHLLHLPLGYFQSRRIGDSVARVRELENIRAFLTGSAITVVLDVLFSVVFFSVMLLYSVKLTLIVLASLLLYVAVSVLMTPLLRGRLHEKFNRSADNQAFLVEAVSGIETIKAMAVEPQMQRRWDNQLAGYVGASFRAGTLASLTHELVGLIGKLVMAATLWFGARLVITGELSVGQLIAFNMLAQRVAQPVMRLAQLWSDFQQMGISMQRLGDILNMPTEKAISAQSTLPTLRGGIQLEQVSFRYRPDQPEVIRQLNLQIQPGEVIGVVGRSGSGKSTLAKLLQRLYVPQQGRVLVDGMDISLLDAASLRRQLGVVLQENRLFNRTLRENIALADPGAPLSAVIQAATLAGAHDFIGQLPEGYDTVIEEQGANLSGGQRQRLAIARALLTNPRILILDEATSALDYESESIIQHNMQAICRNRTVIIIAHRLTAVRNAHRIIALDRGRVVEHGTHDQLVQIPGGYYARLHDLQRQGALV